MAVATNNPTRLLMVLVLAGIGFGIFVSQFVHPNAWLYRILIDGVFLVLESYFTSFLQLLIIPIVSLSVIATTLQVRSNLFRGKQFFNGVLHYLSLTIIAALLAMLAASFMPIQESSSLLNFSQQHNLKHAPAFLDSILKVFPNNIFATFNQNSIFPLLILLVIASWGLLNTSADKASFERITELLNQVTFRLASAASYLMPFAAFVILSRVFAKSPLWLPEHLLTYVAFVLALLAVQGILVYGALLKLSKGPSVFTVYRQAKRSIINAFMTSSTMTTLPLTIHDCRAFLKVGNVVSSTLPAIGSAIGMNGTIIMQAVATIFLAQIYGITLGAEGYLTIFGMLLLCSFTTAGLPGAGLITLGAILTAAGIPVEGVAIILAADRILDMARTSINVAGAIVVTAAVSGSDTDAI